MIQTMRRGVLLLVLIAVATGCGGGSSGILVPPGIVASFAESGTSASADSIRVVGDASGDILVLEMVIGGPTTSTDFYSFAFDLVLGDPLVAEYVSGSATMGSALTTTGGETLQVLATQQGDRVAVGATKIGGTGNGVTGPGETMVVELQFRLLQAGTTTLTIEGAPGGSPVALDSVGSEIGSVTFDGAPASLIGT